MSKTDLQIIDYQCMGPFIKNQSVKEYMEEHRFSATYDCASTMFLLGYIQGKREERARRKAGASNGSI